LFLTRNDRERAAEQKAADEKLLQDRVKAEFDAKTELANIQNEIRRSKLTNYQREREDFLAQRAKMLELMRTSGVAEIELRLFSSNTARMMQQMDAEKDIEILTATEKTKFENRQMFMIKTTEMTMHALGALTSLYTASLGQSEKDQKKAFEANKKFSIAQALISTFLAVNAALTAGGNPIKLATGAQFVEAGIALTAGLANVLKIKNTQFQSSGASGSSSISRPSGSGFGTQQPPSAFNPNTSNPNLPIPTTPQGQPMPLRAYVVDRDIEAASTRRNRLRDFAGI
jgi:hypothetical protein